MFSIGYFDQKLLKYNPPISKMSEQFLQQVDDIYERSIPQISNIYEQAIRCIINQVNLSIGRDICSRKRAIKALNKHNHNVVKAIESLIIKAKH